MAVRNELNVVLYGIFCKCVKYEEIQPISEGSYLKEIMLKIGMWTIVGGGHFLNSK